ncbi:pyridoxamine 5'-phosphate oxidase family protein [Corynebacterium uterequi]|nr:pyridoxamine 5'-phosphate oxidase family protein [Corynebacterium uterequi]
MSANTEYIQELNREESLELLASSSFGRLVVRRTDDIDLFPVNYIVNNGKVYFRTAEGTKLFSVTLNRRVLFEADSVDLDAQTAWSVVIKGEARVLSDGEAIAAEDFPLKPWLPTQKYNFVEVTPEVVSGRSFQLGEEPDRF